MRFERRWTLLAVLISACSSGELPPNAVDSGAHPPASDAALDAGAIEDAVVYPDAAPNQDAAFFYFDAEPDEAGSFADAQPGADATPGLDAMPGADATPGADALPGADATPGVDATPGADALPVADALPGADAQPLVDAGPITSCTNAWDGTGCAARRCVYVPNDSAAECRDLPPAPQAFEHSCDTVSLDCQAGETCIFLTGETQPTCHKICRPGNNADCAGLSGASSSGYSCLLLLGGGFGACAPTPVACHAYADTCPAGQSCQLAGPDVTGCEPVGTIPRGLSCVSGPCLRGAICVDVGTGPLCREPCNTAAPVCSVPNSLCITLTSNITHQPLDFGVCETYLACNPVSDLCPAGDSCQLVGTTLIGCVPVSAATTGQPCAGSPRSCARGNICVDVSGGPGPRCYVACDASHACTSGSCSMLQNEAFGICR